MEETVEDDIKLQRASADLIAQLDYSLPLFLRKTVPGKFGCPQHAPVRRLVRESKTSGLTKLLDQFQELPQLLDRHLSGFVQSLSSAFLEYVELHGLFYHRIPKVATSETIIPLPRAICKILYTLCKVRGPKVIAQLLNAESRYLEPILEAFQTWNQCEYASNETRLPLHGVMVWEERYVMLLWLSHLMLIPFDLTTVVSDNADRGLPSPSIALNVPDGTPRITRCLLNIAIRYLVAPGKESESAKVLLVRLALRTDMLRLGLHQPLIIWALKMLNSGNIESTQSTYESIGALSFLSGFVKSADDNVMRQMFTLMWESLRYMLAKPTSDLNVILTSAVVRKLLVKTNCLLGLAVHRLHLGDPDKILGQILGDVISYLLEALDDKETLVRFAASKALSIIALEVGENITSDIIDRLLEHLGEGLSWREPEYGKGMISAGIKFIADQGWPDYTFFDAIEWHGGILTLAHLLFRHAVPVVELENITLFLCLALNFDQRSALGASIGTNIRDAACFGCWALSRNYSSRDKPVSQLEPQSDTFDSLLRFTGDRLIETACLDPSGNVRRGIALVQCIDYHAVASRTSAMLSVSIQAADKDEIYEDALFEGLLGWRGLENPDAGTRRLSAETIGRLLSGSRSLQPKHAMKVLKRRLRQARLSDVERRHGLLLALAHLIESLHAMWHTKHEGATSLETCLNTDLKSMCTSAGAQEGDEMHDWGLVLDFSSDSPAKKEDLEAAERSQKTVQLSLTRQEDLVVKYSSQAMVGFLLFTPRNEKQQVLESIIAMVRSSDAWCQGQRKVGAIRAVGLATVVFQDPAAEYGTIPTEVDAIIRCLLERMHAGNDIDVRCAALESLCLGPLRLCQVIPEEVIAALQVCLDDYTNDHRGDVGSLVRVAAIDAAGLVLRKRLVRSSVAREHIVARICALAVEKLDKVRYNAAKCLQNSLGALGLLGYAQMWAISLILQKVLLIITVELSLILTILAGFISAAGDSSISLLQSSRTALLAHTEKMSLTDLCLLCDNLVEIVRDNKYSRISIWAMEVIAFLFDVQIIQRLQPGGFGWRNLFVAIKHAHFKSTDIRRLEAAIAVYSGLTSIETVKADVYKKLCDMLRNPIAKVRNTAADVLFSALQDKAMLVVNWSDSPNELMSERARILGKIETLV
ncbi:MAG: hypothetical protein Q9163_002184 [Psora crenata]